jgi:hypothetical protein
MISSKISWTFAFRGTKLFYNEGQRFDTDEE